MDASPFRSGNSQHFLLRLDAVVDPLRLLRSLHDRCLIILRNKSVVELGREKIGNGVGTSLYPRPARLLLAPLGNVGNALRWRSEEHTSELQSLMRISYAVLCLKKKKQLYKSYI